MFYDRWGLQSKSLRYFLIFTGLPSSCPWTGLVHPLARERLCLNTLNPRNPYYLHLDENPGSVLVTPSLNDNNYHNWRKCMKRELSSKNKLSFINGSLPRPSSTDPDFESCDRCNNMVLSWITRTLAHHIAQSAICFDNATDLWNDLQE
ncbi:uncharacterized protein [Cicer arietinum]|uniref:uncharacterized protein n=1 Tax=Cicer arietinum TaxID=3827 RepID=UPI003CC58707